jgi:thymidylate synthase
MSALIELEDLQGGYVELVNFVRANGRHSSPRGMRTIEVEDAMIIVYDLRATVPTTVGRKPNLEIAALEALQLISGRSTPELLVAASPTFAQFREVDGSFWGAYGSRVHGQVVQVVDKLRSDKDSRQGVITLWNPLLDSETGRKDYPCTITLGFRLRGDRLNASVVMRSNDVWLGTCYDIFQFTQLQYTIANMLGVDVGTYTHVAWSLHLYERDIDKVDELHAPTSTAQFLPTGVANQQIAADLLKPLQPDETAPIDPGQRWYRELVLRAYGKMSDAT